jgi:hypothetical protein
LGTNPAGFRLIGTEDVNLVDAMGDYFGQVAAGDFHEPLDL